MHFKYSFLMLVLLFQAQVVHAGVWIRESSDTLSFEGPIKADEYDRFSAVMDSSVKVLKVNSGGGVTSAALKIAFDLQQNEVAIYVNNWCLSSCANYLFLAAKERHIQKGIVGYHGNVQACFGGDKWQDLERQLREQGMTEEQIQEFRQDLLMEIEEEKRFLNLVGVSQELFDISCELDKGAGDGQTYDFLLPSPGTFEKFGITKVDGVQDPDVIKEFPGKLLYR